MDALTTAHAATDKSLDAMEKYVRSIYLRSVREIYKSWQKFFEKERKRIDKLQEDYEKAKKSGDKTLIKETGIALEREKKKETVQNKRFQDAVRQTAENLLHVNETAVEYLNGRLPETYVTNFNAVGELCEGAVTGYSYNIVDENTVRELAMSDTSLLPYKEIDPAKDIAWNVRQMKSEVLQGILQGENMQTIAKRLSNVIGMNENSAVRNARTMVTAAENKGRQDGFYQAEEDGIILEKYWLCVHGERTREAHAAAGNDYSKSKSIPQSQPFIVGGEKLMFPGDNSMGASGWNLYNCRCSVAAVVKGFKKAQVQKAMAENQESFAEQLASRKLSPHSTEYGTFEEFREARKSFVAINGNESDFLDDVFAGKIDIGTGWVGDDGKHKIAQLENTIAELQKKYPLNPAKNLDYGTTIQKLRVCDYENAYMYLPDGRNDRRLVDSAIGQVFENDSRNAVIAFDRNWMYQTLEQTIEERSKTISLGKVLDSVSGSSPQTVAMHEWGHLMSNHITNAMINGESTAEEYWKWYQTISKDEIRNGLSDYATTNRGEFEAECFAELMMPNPRPLALKYKEFLDKCIELGY